MNIISNNNFNIVEEYFKNSTQCIIFGKGPTFKPMKKSEVSDNTSIICINETINYFDDCDLLVCNDIESFDKINLNKLSNCKNILVPYHIHINCKPNIDITYNNVIEKIKPYFSGNFIVYNLTTTKKYYPNFIRLLSRLTSSHTAFEFIGTFIKNIKKCDFYGVAVSCSNENAIFYNEKNSKSNSMHQKKVSSYINEINKLSKLLKFKYTLN